MSHPPGPPDNEDSAPEQPGYGPASSGPPDGNGQALPTNGKATTALIVGVASLVLSFCCLGVAGVVAVVLGVKARKEISASGGRQTGDGMALAGIITGAVAVLISLALVMLLMVLMAMGNYDFNHMFNQRRYEY